MIDQSIVNWLFTALAAVLGFLLNSIWQAVKDLQTSDKELASKVSSIEVLVVGDYVRKPELQTLSTAIFQKLDRIEDKIDNKADK